MAYVRAVGGDVVGRGGRDGTGAIAADRPVDLRANQAVRVERCRVGCCCSVLILVGRRVRLR